MCGLEVSDRLGCSLGDVRAESEFSDSIQEMKPIQCGAHPFVYGWSQDFEWCPIASRSTEFISSSIQLIALILFYGYPFSLA